MVKSRKKEKILDSAIKSRKEITRFSDRVRNAAKALKKFTAGELADKIEVMDRKEKRAVSAYIREFIKSGEMARVNPDGPAKRGSNGNRCEEQYYYIPRVTKITNRQRMWDIIRRMPSPFFFIRDLEQITEIKYSQVKRFCSFLRHAGWAERIGYGKYRRIKAFPLTCPPDRRYYENRKNKL